MSADAVLDVHPDEIVTGEAIALDSQPVGFLLRTAGAVIDVVATLVLLLAVNVAARWAFGASILSSNLDTIVTVATTAVVLIALPTTVEGLSRGRSLGKLAIGGRIVRDDGGAAGVRHAFIRAVAGVLEIWLTLGAVALIVGVFTPRSQRLGDLLAGTYSERTRVPALPDVVLTMPPQLTGWASVADVSRLPDRLARRAAQFTRGAAGMDAPQRSRIATSLAAEVAGFVSPVPPVDSETFLLAALAVRRDREQTAITERTRRSNALLAGITAAPRDFPVP